MNYMRPPYCWNFFDDHEEKIEHVLRPDAQPQKCYIDGRVESIMEDLYQLGHHLTMYNDVNWATLRKFTIEIFKAEAKKEHEQALEDEKKNN